MAHHMEVENLSSMYISQDVSQNITNSSTIKDN